MKALIIDDEAPARSLIRELLKSHPELEIIGEAGNGFDAIKLIQELNPDLIFLDIQMPKINGLELMEILENPPMVIFTTAFEEYAIKAFEVNAIDYLLKPIQEDRLQKALSRVKELQTQKPDFSNITELKMSETEKISRIVVKTGNKIRILELADIIRIESDDDYVNFITADQKFLKKQRMKFLEERLPEDQFCRIHRSHIIRISCLQKIELLGKDTHVAILSNQERIPVSVSGYKILKERLDF